MTIAAKKEPGLGATKTGRTTSTPWKEPKMATQIVSQNAPTHADLAAMQVGVGPASSRRVWHTFTDSSVEVGHGFISIDDGVIAATFYKGTPPETAAARRAVHQAALDLQAGRLTPGWLVATITTTLPDGSTEQRKRWAFEVRETTAGSICRDQHCSAFGGFEEHAAEGALHNREIGTDVEVSWTDVTLPTLYVLGAEEYATSERVDALIAELERAREFMLLKQSRRAAECPCWDSSAGACGECSVAIDR